MAAITESTHPGWTKLQAVEAGKTHLRLRCPRCAMLRARRWADLTAIPDDLPIMRVLPRLRCSSCGSKVDIHYAEAFRRSDEVPDYSTPGATRYAGTSRGAGH